jgi:hypothetical protein
MKGERGKRLRKKRGELIERSFAHTCETGGLRRVHLRGHENILKRLLVHVGALNLGLLMRQLIGKGTPRGLQGLMATLTRLFTAYLNLLKATQARLKAARLELAGFRPQPSLPASPASGPSNATGC